MPSTPGCAANLTTAESALCHGDHSHSAGCVQLDQLTVNKYPAGVGLSPHVDAHSAFTGPVISLSLGSSAVMEFRRDGERKCLFLPRRSLAVMAGECRYAWCAPKPGSPLCGSS